MKMRILWSFLSLLLICYSVSGQDPAKDQAAEKARAERRAKVIDAIAKEASELTLPENGALISARLGAATWKEDPERAGILFRNAVANLIAAQNFAEANKTPTGKSYDLLNSQAVRPAILTSIAVGDAEFALESLYRSRPLAVQKALAQRIPGTKLNNTVTNTIHIAQQEINLEQRLISMVAEQKPQRSIELLKENIKKQLSVETLGMLKKLWEKDSSAANDLANGVIDRLVAAQFVGPNNQVNHDLFNLSNAVMGEFVRERQPEEKGLTFDEPKMRSLAQKVFAAYIEHRNTIGYIPLGMLEPIAKRLGSPGMLAQLKKASESNRGLIHSGHRPPDPEYTKLMASKPTAEALIAEANKFPPETRRNIYLTAANRLSDAGQYDRALALLSEHFDDDALENAISSLNWYQAHILVNRGDYDGAEAMMMEFNDSNRISALTSLATTIYNKDQKENRSRAIGLLQRVRSLMPEKPESSNEFSQLFQLIGTMATIEPSEAFRNIEAVVVQINDLTEAWAVVNAYQGGNMRRGEYSMAGGYNLGIYIDPSILLNLGKSDFARTMSLVDSFSRREMRIMLLMSLLEMRV